MRHWPGAGGQTITEVVLVLPIFFLVVFAILQTCHLGLAIAVVSYGASAVAEEAVTTNDSSINSSDRFNKILSVGLKEGRVKTTTDPGSKPGDVGINVKVNTCAELPAYPFVGEFWNKTFQSGRGDSLCGGSKGLGPVSMKGPPYIFVISGQATARMNYPKKS